MLYIFNFGESLDQCFHLSLIHILLFKQCREYLSGLSVDDRTIQQAFQKADSEQHSFINTLVAYNKNILQQTGKGETCLLYTSLQAEHVLSLYIETPENRLLFDTGASDLFIRNAQMCIRDRFIGLCAVPRRILL